MPHSKDWSRGSPFTHPIFKIKIIPPVKAPFREPNSTEEKMDAAETDGRAMAVLLRVTVLKELRVLTIHGSEAILVVHLLFQSDEKRVCLITVTATPGRFFSLSMEPSKGTTTRCSW